jgi:signal peptidase I
MSQAPRYFFVITLVGHPVGGLRVLFEMIETLRASGRQAFPLYFAENETYEFSDYDGPAYYEAGLTKLFSKSFPAGRLSFLPFFKTRKFEKPKAPTVPNIIYEPLPGDTIVIPDFWYPEQAAYFSDQDKVLVSQDVFGFARPNMRDRESKGSELAKFKKIITTSDASAEIIRQTTNHTTDRVTLHVGDNLKFHEKKRVQIAYIPRKRRQEAETIISILKDLPEFDGVDFLPIGGGMSNEAVAQTLHDSLIFLSFCSREGFGLPPAEAMKAGCITIGYTGVGGEEYFTPDVGFPILDSDIADFVATTRRVIKEYRDDPAELDALRKVASRSISKRYSKNAMETSVLAAWDRLEQGE